MKNIKQMLTTKYKMKDLGEVKQFLDIQIVRDRSARTITTLSGVCQLLLTIRRCHNRACEYYRQPYRPEEEGAWALPHGEFGLDIIALIGALRDERHQSVPEIHQELSRRGVIIAERTITNLLARYEE